MLRRETSGRAEATIQRLEDCSPIMLVDQYNNIKSVLLLPAEYELLRAAAALHERFPIYSKRLAEGGDAWRGSETLPW